MKRRGGDFESEADESHDDPDEEKRLHGSSGEFLSYGSEARCSGHAIDEA